MLKTTELITPLQAAKRAGVTKQAIYHAISTGRLRAVKIAGVFFLRIKDVDEYSKTKRRKS